MRRLVTRTISRQVILTLLNDLIPIMQTHWGDTLQGEHGGVSGLKQEDQWVKTSFDTRLMKEHLLNEEQVHNFNIGDDDYWIYGANTDENIQICHESDIHFALHSEEFYAQIRRMLLRHDVELYDLDRKCWITL